VLLGLALGFSLNPVFPPLVLGLVLGGYAFFTATGYVVERLRGTRPVGLWADALHPVLAAILLWITVALPGFAIHKCLYIFLPPPLPPAKWSFVIPVALDLETPLFSTVTGWTRNTTQWMVVGVVAVAMIVAARQRNRAALAFLACLAIIPAARLANDYRLHSFQGVLYPLSLAGAAFLVGSTASRRQVAAVAVMVVILVGLRMPQHLLAGKWYLYHELPDSTVLRQSEANALRAAVANETVDVWLACYPDNHFVLSELLAQGTHVQLQGLAWQRTLAYHFVQLTPHNLTAPKARFSLVESATWVPQNSERWVGPRWKLIEDRPAITMLSAGQQIARVYSNPDQDGVWLTTAANDFVIHNGTDRDVPIHLHGMLVVPGPRLGKRDTLRFKHGADTGSVAITADKMPGEIPLKLKPGFNQIALWVETSEVPISPTTWMVGFGDWRIEFCDPQRAKE
jgi:hypothetical protein